MSNVIGLSEEHEANLRKLAAYLKGGELAARFDMSKYSDLRHADHCGAVGCAVGHGPFAGIEKRPSEDWSGYSRRVFGFCQGTGDNYGDWCFGAAWDTTDNTPGGAAARIEWLLDRGLPEDWEDQEINFAPLCYREPQKAEAPNA